jgi:hypothetical protein
MGTGLRWPEKLRGVLRLNLHLAAALFEIIAGFGRVMNRMERGTM